MSSVFHLDEIEIEPGGFSSEHLHERKSNTFIVLKGILRIMYKMAALTKEDRKSYPSMMMQVRHEILKGPSEKDRVTIHENVSHQFFALTKVHALEIYQAVGVGSVPIDLNDIVRFSNNGVWNHAEERHKEASES